MFRRCVVCDEDTCLSGMQVATVDLTACCIPAGKQLVATPVRQGRVACGATGVQANLFSRFFRVIRSYANSVGATIYHISIPYSRSTD